MEWSRATRFHVAFYRHRFSCIQRHWQIDCYLFFGILIVCFVFVLRWLLLLVIHMPKQLWMHALFADYCQWQRKKRMQTIRYFDWNVTAFLLIHWAHGHNPSVARGERLGRFFSVKCCFFEALIWTSFSEVIYIDVKLVEVRFLSALILPTSCCNGVYWTVKSNFESQSGICLIEIWWTIFMRHDSWQCFTDAESMQQRLTVFDGLTSTIERRSELNQLYRWWLHEGGHVLSATRFIAFETKEPS